MSFENLNIIQPINRALIAEGFTSPTPIQEQAIPVILDGKDILGCAQTGTGKTAAFAIPIIQLLAKDKNPGKAGKKKIFPGALILTPTRELAVQISDNFTSYGKFTGLRTVVIYGGVSQQKQTEKLKRGVDVIIATPGRLLDLMNQGFVNLNYIELLVLDEADRMLDMGFITDIQKIIEKIPEKRQTLFFSATMPGTIMKLADSILTDPVRIDVSPKSITVDVIKQGVYFVSKPDKKALLLHLLKRDQITSALVFTRTKKGADHVSKILNGAKINADAIHGDKSQNARQRALNNFKAKKIRVLVATDIAARGIDVQDLSHVINYEIPEDTENYVHRIGRTGRAGLSGTALSFCDSEERFYLKEINKFIKMPIPVIQDHPFEDKGQASLSMDTPRKSRSRSGKDFKNRRKNSSRSRRKNTFKKVKPSAQA